MIEHAQQIIALVKAHWIEVLALIGAVDVILGIVTKLTPTQFDDNLYVVVHKWISKLVVKK